MCVNNESPLSTTKPSLNNKQQQSNDIGNQTGSSTNLQNLTKQNSIKHTAATVADKNRKNEANNSALNSVGNFKSGKYFVLSFSDIESR